jgi:hypothetical protein
MLGGSWRSGAAGRGLPRLEPTVGRRISGADSQRITQAPPLWLCRFLGRGSERRCEHFSAALLLSAAEAGACGS